MGGGVPRRARARGRGDPRRHVQAGRGDLLRAVRQEPVPEGPDRRHAAGAAERRQRPGEELDRVQEPARPRRSGTVDGQGAEAWKATTCPHQRKCKNPPFSLRFMMIQGCRLAGLHLKNSKGKNIAVHNSENVTMAGLTITAPGHSPNTDGIHVSASTRINITGVTIGVGDDCISVGPGTRDMVIANVVCGPGHGISIGSLGKYKNEDDVSGVKVKNCTISGTSNGLRIKSWPGSPPSKALNISFEDIKLNNVSNPIIIDQTYCPAKSCTSKPSQVMIKDVVFRNIVGTSNTAEAVTLACSAAVPCQGVQLEEIKLRPVPGACPNVTAVCTNAIGKALGHQIGQCL